MENKPSANLNQPNPNATGFQFSLGNISFGLTKPVPKKENYDLQKLETIRETLKCMICGKFPRPNNMMFFEDLFRCSKCFHLMCQACQQLQAQPNKTRPQPGPNGIQAPSVFAQPNQHSNQARNKNFCSFCNQPNFYIQPTYPCKNKICTLVKDVAARELASVFQFHPCINKDNGCTEKMILENLLGHEKSCLLRNILCPFKGKDGCTDPEKNHFWTTHGSSKSKTFSSYQI